MLSKSQISFVNALQQKKHRKEHSLFIVEGSKSISEFSNSNYQVNTIFRTPQAVPKLGKLSHKVKLHEITVAELKKISVLSTPQDALALIQIPERTPLAPESFKGKWVLVLDGVQDPGNLGTIIRTADWFGFSEIVCSTDTVDAYNPKTVQASMGSLSRIQVFYEDLLALLPSSNLPVYGTLLEGQSIYSQNFGSEGFMVLGNEGNGISKDIQNILSTAITIPRFGKAESLNVAVTAAIICSELKRTK